jgi:hypothetical protein
MSVRFIGACDRRSHAGVGAHTAVGYGPAAGVHRREHANPPEIMAGVSLITVPGLIRETTTRTLFDRRWPVQHLRDILRR